MNAPRRSWTKPPADVAWHVAAKCLAKCDFAGFDAAMSIYRNLSREPGSANNAPGRNS